MSNVKILGQCQRHLYSRVYVNTQCQCWFKIIDHRHCQWKCLDYPQCQRVDFVNENWLFIMQPIVMTSMSLVAYNHLRVSMSMIQKLSILCHSQCRYFKKVYVNGTLSALHFIFWWWGEVCPWITVHNQRSGLPASCLPEWFLLRWLFPVGLLSRLPGLALAWPDGPGPFLASAAFSSPASEQRVMLESQSCLTSLCFCLAQCGKISKLASIY